MNNAMHRLMLSCDRATFLITKKEYQKLTCKENAQLKLHLMGCKFCRAFKDQNAILSDQLRTLVENPSRAELSEEKKKEIAETLNAQ